MSRQETITVTTTPASGSASAWTGSRSGPTVISIYGDWGAATSLSFVYSPISDGTDDTVAPPIGASNQGHPVFRQVLAADVEQVFTLVPGESLYKLAVIPADNDGTTNLAVVFS